MTKAFWLHKDQGTGSKLFFFPCAVYCFQGRTTDSVGRNPAGFHLTTITDPLQNSEGLNCQSAQVHAEVSGTGLLGLILFLLGLFSTSQRNFCFVLFCLLAFFFFRLQRANLISTNARPLWSIALPKQTLPEIRMTKIITTPP